MNKDVNSLKQLNKEKNKKKVGDIIFITCLLAWPLLHWCVFWFYTNLKTFTLPFMEWDPWVNKYIFPNSQGLFANFIKQIKGFFVVDSLGQHSTIYRGFFNTFHSLAINLILLPLAIFIGYALSKHVPGERLFRVIFFMPNIISTVVMCLAFRFMFEANDSLFVGPMAKVIQALGFDFNGWDPLNKGRIWGLIYTFCLWAGLSVNVVLISSAFQRLPKEIIESARLDGITFFKELWYIGMPLIMPTITTFLINAVIAVTQFYLQPYLLLTTWEGGYETIPWIIFSYTQTADQEGYVLIATIGIMFSAIMLPLIMLAKYIGDKLTPDVEF